VDEIEKEIPKYNRDDTANFTHLWQYIEYYKWLINLIAVALPYGVLVIAMNIANIFFQFKLNDAFGDGNLVFIAGSVFLWFQSLMSLLLIFEEPSFLLFHKTERSVSFDMAIIFNVFYVLFAVRFYYVVFKDEPE
jgi:hypothetical protein